MQDEKKCLTHINPYLTNGFYHHYQLDESTFIFRGVRSDFKFLSHFSMKFLQANRIAPDGTPRSAVSHLGLFCLCPIKGTPGLNELSTGKADTKLCLEKKKKKKRNDIKNSKTYNVSINTMNPTTFRAVASRSRLFF